LEVKMRFTLTLAALLLAAPLVAAQQTVVVPDVVVEVEPTPITNEITVEVMSDSVRLERIAAAVEDIAAILAECGCAEPSSTSNLVRVGQGALVLAAFFIGFQVKRVADAYEPKDSGNGDSNGDSDTSSDDYPESK
jgi:hypothetical protein